MRTSPSTAEEGARILHDKLAALTITGIWWIVGLLLSVASGHRFPILAAAVLGVAHVSVVSVRTARARRAHRVAFWAGQTDVREQPLGRIIDDIRPRGRDAHR